MSVLQKFKPSGPVAKKVVLLPDHAFFVRVMPLHDPELCGRIRDNVALLVEYADVCVGYIGVRQKLDAQQQAMKQALDRARAAISGIDSEYKQQQSQLREHNEEVHLRMC